MRAVSLFMFLLFLPVVFAAPFDAASLTVDGFLSTPIEIRPSGSNPSISSLTTSMSWYPISHQGQEVLFFTTVPEAVDEEGVLVTSLNKPALGHHSFDIEYQVKTFVDPVLVSEPVSFPLAPIDASLSDYVAPTTTIDINPAIRSMAAKLAADEDDLFVLVTKIAAWTKSHINYDLSTLNVEASQPSSWVLENREGVCDEMTNLFISFLRSLGVPARFVSGLAYTESDLFDNPWGAHGWAEVYFPGHGWVPFDVTYGQLGWVDASHIVFAAGVDSEKFGSSFTWLGHDVTVDIDKTIMEARVVDESGSLPVALSLDVAPLQEEVGHHSYQLVVVDVENTKPYYVADELQLAQVTGLSVFDESFQLVTLAPYEKKRLYWRVLVEGELQDNYVYTFPLIVVSQRGASDESSFSVTPQARSLSLSWVERFMDSFEDETFPYDEFIDFSCQASLVNPRVDESTSITCALNNSGEIDLSHATICLFAECQEVSVAPGKVTTARFSWSSENASLFSLPFVLQHRLVEKTSFVTLDVTVPPVITITNIFAPSSLDFSDTAVISFVVSQEGAVAQNAVISLRGPRVTNEWTFPLLKGKKVFEVALAGDALSLDNNEFFIVVDYFDDRQEQISIEKSFEVSLGEATWYQKLFLYVLGLFE